MHRGSNALQAGGIQLHHVHDLPHGRGLEGGREGGREGGVSESVDVFDVLPLPSLPRSLPPSLPPSLKTYLASSRGQAEALLVDGCGDEGADLREGGKEGGREGERVGEWMEGREGGREGGRERTYLQTHD